MIMKEEYEMDDLKQYMEQQLKNPEFKEEYEKTRIEFEITRAIVNARCEKNMTQKELSLRTGIRQSNISRIENGSSSPNISTLEKIARGLGKRLYIEFRQAMVKLEMNLMPGLTSQLASDKLSSTDIEVVGNFQCRKRYFLLIVIA